MSERILSAGEVAKMYGVDTKTVTRWARAGKIPFFLTPGGHRRFRESQILDMMESGRRIRLLD